MSRKRILIAAAAALVVAGGWLAQRAWHTAPVNEPGAGTGAGVEASSDAPRPGSSHASRDFKAGENPDPHPGQRLRPPEPNRRFMDFTPEQRVEFARRGHGPGG